MEPFASAKAFRFIWIYWTILGLSPLPNRGLHYRVYSILLKLTLPVIPAMQQIAQVFLGESFEAITSNLYVGLEWVCGDVKYLIILLGFRRIYRGHSFLTRLDTRIQRSPGELAIMKGVVTTCNRVFFVYNAIFTINIIFGFVSNLIFRRLMYESYFPWDWQASYGVYLTSHIYELVMSVIHSMLHLTTDCYAFIYLYMMVGHVKTLGMRISRIGYDQCLSPEENYKELIECVHDYNSVLQFFNHFRPIIGGTVFVQFFVTAFSLCFATFYYIYFNHNFGVLLTTSAFMGMLFVQITPCCYLVNDLMIVSDNLTTDLYSCNWMEQNLKFRKALIIFMQRTQKTNTILAGNLAPATLQTCLSIVRFSFSVFTLLSQLSD